MGPTRTSCRTRSYPTGPRPLRAPRNKTRGSKRLASRRPAPRKPRRRPREAQPQDPVQAQAPDQARPDRSNQRRSDPRQRDHERPAPGPHPTGSRAGQPEERDPACGPGVRGGGRMIGRIRTVKPEIFSDEKLWDLSLETGLPLLQAFEGLWCYADREGRFEWRPRALKTLILPYWEGDFVRALEALERGRYVVRYVVDGQVFGYV